MKWILREGVWRITKHNLDRSDKITTVSPSLVEKLKKYGYDAKLITNGVDTDYFKPKDSKEGKRRLGLDEDCFVIGYVGALEDWLNFDEVIRGISELLHAKNDVYLAIIGGALFTDYEARLKKLVKEKRIENNVKFYGLIEYKNLPKYIAGMDVCLIPFKITPVSDIALPNKFFEYSACGKPILSTPLPDVVKVGGENLFIYKDKEEFVGKVKYIMANPRKYKMDVNEYSWKRKAEELESLLQELIAGYK
jgi:glycosyltransferase involved in cell wall biosynthesis